MLGQGTEDTAQMDRAMGTKRLSQSSCKDPWCLPSEYPVYKCIRNSVPLCLTGGELSHPHLGLCRLRIPAR